MHEKFKKFIQDCHKLHPSQSDVLEAISKAFTVCMEGEVFPEDILLVDTPEAEQLSTALKSIEKRTGIEKSELNNIYNLFIRMDRNKFNEPLSKIFNKIKQKLIDLAQGTGSIEDILVYMGMFI